MFRGAVAARDSHILGHQMHGGQYYSFLTIIFLKKYLLCLMVEHSTKKYGKDLFLRNSGKRRLNLTVMHLAPKKASHEPPL